MADRPAVSAASLLFALAGLAGVATGQATGCAASRAQLMQPLPLEGDSIWHIVLVVLDDFGVDKCGAYGEHPTAGPTPTIDAWAAQGVRYTQCRVEPVCSPTRAAILTGLDPTDNGIGVVIPHYNPQGGAGGPYAPSDSLPWLANRLLVDGVRSYAIGKWHLTNVGVAGFHNQPNRTGFEWHHGALANLNPGQGFTAYSWGKNIAAGTTWSEPTVATFVTTDNAIEAWNALHASAGERSFVYLAFNAPHQPWTLLPPSGTYTPVSGTQTDPVLQQYSLEAADTMLGQLDAFYAQQHPADAAHTLWIVMGDNGTEISAVESPWAGDHAKTTCYEGGVRVPLIVRGFGIDDPGRVSDHPVSAVDFWATVVDLFAGSPPTARNASISFAESVRDASSSPARTWSYFRTHTPNGFGPYTDLLHGATDGRWKLIERAIPTPVTRELYDLIADPLETNDLWPASTPEETAAVTAGQAVLDAGGSP